MEISGHILERSYGFVIIFLIPCVVNFFKKPYVSTFILGLLFFLSFAEGALQLLGLLSPSYNRLLRDVLIIIGFLSIYKHRGKELNLPGKNIIFVLIFLITISFFFNDSSFFQLVLFVRRLGFSFLLLYYVINIEFTEKTFRNIFNFIICLFVVQIPISFIKLAFHGIGEDYIGSVSTIAGSITTSITLLASSYLLTLILFKGGGRYIILFLLFLFFSIIGAKRVIFVFVPLLILLGFFYFGKIKLKQLFLILFLLPLSLVFILKISPSLNPEHKVWGSFSPDYVIDYFNTRENAAKALSGNQSNSRILVFNYLLHNFIRGPKDIILGHGPGIVFPKNTTDIKKYGKGEKYLLNKFGLGYGMRLGVFWLFFQIGFLGVFLFLLFHYSLYKKIKRNTDSRNLLFIRLLFTVFLLDTFLYSSTFITPSAIPITFYTVLGFYLNKKSKLVIVA